MLNVDNAFDGNLIILLSQCHGQFGKVHEGLC